MSDLCNSDLCNIIWGLVLGFPVSIIANLVTPLVRTYLMKTSRSIRESTRSGYFSMRESAQSTFFSIREIRKSTILENYSKVQEYEKNPLKMQIDFLENLAVVLSVSLPLIVTFVFCSIVTLIFGSMFFPIPNNIPDLFRGMGFVLLGFFGMLITSTSMYSITNIYHKLRNIDKLREDTLKQLIKLGYSQEDLENFEWAETKRKALKRE